MLISDYIDLYYCVRCRAIRMCSTMLPQTSTENGFSLWVTFIEINGYSHKGTLYSLSETKGWYLSRLYSLCPWLKPKEGAVGDAPGRNMRKSPALQLRKQPEGIMWKNEIIWLTSKREMLIWLQNCVILAEEGAVGDALRRNMGKSAALQLWKQWISCEKMKLFGWLVSEKC